MLIKGGLRDRIALHKLAEYIEREEIPYTSMRKVRRGLKGEIRRFREIYESEWIPSTDKRKNKNVERLKSSFYDTKRTVGISRTGK